MSAEILTHDSTQKLPGPNLFKRLINSWNLLDRFMKMTVITMLLIIAVTPLIIAQRFSLFQQASQTTQVRLYVSSQTFSLPGDFFGQSADDADGSKWDGELGDKTVGLTPLLIRYPTAFAECWDWRNGTKFPSSVFPCDYHANLHTDTLADFSKILQKTGATPVFVLNMYSSGQTIDGRISDQINFLKTAQGQYGMPIAYIELGNEVADRLPTHVLQFPTVDSYAREANEWIRRLWQEFPGAKIGVSGLSVGDNSSILSWNTPLLTQVPQADALILHMYTSPYYSSSVTNQDQAIAYMKSDEGRRTLFAMPYFLESRFLRILSLLPKDRHVWITEHGIIDDKYWAVYGTWAEGLVRASIGLHFIEHSDQVSMAIPHQIYSSSDYGLVFRSEGSGFWGKPNGSPASIPYAYTSTGLTYNEIAQATGKDTKRVAKLQFSPTLSDIALGNSYPTILGYLFIKPSSNQAIILNTGSHDLQLTLTDSTLLNNFDTAEIISGDYATLVTGDTSGVPNDLLKASVKIPDDRTVLIPAYSITRLSGNRSSQNTPSNTNDNTGECTPSCNPLPLRCYYSGPGANCSCGQIVCLSPVPTATLTPTETPLPSPTGMLENNTSGTCTIETVCGDLSGEKRNNCIANLFNHGCPTPTPTIGPSPTSEISPTSPLDQSQNSSGTPNNCSNTTCSNASYGCYYDGLSSDNCGCGNLVCIPTLTPTSTPTPTDTSQTAIDTSQSSGGTDFSQFTIEPPIFTRQWEEDITTVVSSIVGKNPLLAPILQSIPSPTQSQGLIRLQNTTSTQKQSPQNQQSSQQSEDSSGLSLPQINIQLPGGKKTTNEEPQIGITGQPTVKKAGKYFSIFDFVLGLNNIVANFVKNLITGSR